MYLMELSISLKYWISIVEYKTQDLLIARGMMIAEYDILNFLEEL